MSDQSDLAFGVWCRDPRHYPRVPDVPDEICESFEGAMAHVGDRILFGAGARYEIGAVRYVAAQEHWIAAGTKPVRVDATDTDALATVYAEGTR